MMEFVRKIGRSFTGSSTSQSPQTNSLGLLTLRRQFRDVCFSMSPLTQSELQEKLYTVLPLFLKVFKNLPPSDMKEKFGDVLQFSTRVSNLMVTEIRKRASNKSTEQASVDIANFLAPAVDGSPSSRGWTLLNCLSLLAAGDSSIIDCMTTTHLPSTLVKCLYLFFDLPTRETDHSYTVTLEGTDMLQKVFVQTLVRLCNYISPAEELSRKDDLALLFSAVTSWCSPHNKNWRTAASDVLITISRHGLSHNVVEYIRNKNKHCIKTCINNLWRATVSVEEESPSAILLDVDLAEQLLCVLRFINNSSEVTQLLLDDFRHHQGYIFIAEFVLRLETAASESEKHRKALLSAIGAVEKLTTCGFNELKPEPISRQSFQTNYVVPVPIGKGDSVRNIHAFELLETLFIRSRTTFLARAVLDAVFAVYCRDPANYFILLDLKTMSSFSERLSMKDPEIYPHYFAIFEYISLTLGYIPSKELLSISLLLKTDSNVECSTACLNSLQKLLSSSLNTYRDIFREVGILEMLIKCLQRYSGLLKAVEVNSSSKTTRVDDIKESHHNFGRLTMDLLVEMIHSSPNNASLFRETGGARCAFNTISYPECRHSALSLVEALILQPVSKGNDDDMTTLLGFLSTLSLHDIQLKIDILKTLHKVVSKSEIASLMFQKVGGFINLISIILGMEGYLSLEPSDFWKEHAQHGYVLLEALFQILAVVLKHSSNERYFEIEIGYEAFLGAIQALGCFSQNPLLSREVENWSHENLPKCSFVSCKLQDQTLPEKEVNCKTILVQKILCLFKLLYMCACDLFKDELQTKIDKLQHSISKCSSLSDDSPRSCHEYSHSRIVHPNFFKLYIQLIPCISVANLDDELLVPLQFYLMDEFNLVLKRDRNEQIVCNAGLLSTLLSSFEDILIRDEQPLNLVCQKTLETLATQSISPQELRKLLRVGRPLHCDNLLVSNGVVALNRVKSLVSLATPRNIGMISDIYSSYKPPPCFIEFDMSIQGCSHLFIPNIVPQSTTNSSASGASVAAGERLFPPAHGIAASAWIYVENFCRQQIHPIRILTLERQVVTTQQNFICLSIMISPRKKRLIISTHEQNTSTLITDQGEPEDTKETIGFSVDHLCLEGQWHHVQVVVQRSTVLKHSTVTACFNGSILGASKIRYISTAPGGSSQQALNSPIGVHGWIGTPPQLSSQSTLIWKLASLRLFDETSSFVLNSSAVQTRVGPEYVGNYQNTLLQDGSTGPVFAEEHLCFSLLPSSVESITSSMLQRTKMKFDFKLLASKLNLKKVEDLTFVDFFPNACLHTPGPTRTHGGFAVGRKYKDAPRCFVPMGVGRVLQDVGGISVALYLVAMASDVEGLYAAVKFLVCVLKSDGRGILEMERTNGYQALGMLLKEKKSLLNSHILHLTFSIAGTVDTGQGTAASVTNHSAFEYLLCDLEIWHNSPQELHKSLFDHFYELLTESSDTKSTHGVITGFSFIQKCVYFMYSDSSLSYTTVVTIMKVIQAIFGIEARKEDILSFGQFGVSLIASSNVSEKNVELGEISIDFLESQTRGKIDESCLSKRTIHFRNIVLELVLKCVTASNNDNTTFCEVLETCLGFDWILLFMQSHLHFSSVTSALQLLFTILQCSYSLVSTNMPTHLASAALQAPTLPGYSPPLTLIERFRCGENFGGWLQGTDVLLEKKEDSLLGFNVRSINDFTSERYHHSVHLDAVPVPGFLALQHLMSYHASSHSVLKLLLQHLIGQYDPNPVISKFSLVEIHQYFETNRSKLSETEKLLSMEVCQLINVMLRQLLHQNWKDSNKSSWLRNDPLTLVESFQHIYDDDISELSYLFATAEYLTSFMLTLFQPEAVVSLSGVSSPKDILSLEGLLPLDSKLSSHPCVKPLHTFMCKILWDSVTAQKNKSSQMIDIILEIPVEKNPSSCLSEYVTDVILHVIGFQVANLAELIKSSHCSTSISYLISKIVDKVWQGLYTDDCKKLFHFITELLCNHQSKLSSAVSTNIYRSLYRLILYQLSRKHVSISEKMNLLDALHCLTTRRNVVFSEKFRDALYVSCLCHCLFMVSGNSGGKDFGLEADQRQTTWHVGESSKQQSVTIEAAQEATLWTPSTPQEKGQVLLNNAAARVWSELMATKRDVLTDIFKVTFLDLGTEQSNLDSARLQIREAAAKAWSNFLVQEKKMVIGSAKESPSQQKLVKRMSYLVSSRRSKKEFISKLGKNISIQDSHLWTLNHISVVQSLVRLQYNEHEQEENHLKHFTAKEWNRTTAELTRERAVWGPEEEETLTKWTLDSTEGPCRMRKRMMKDETFYLRYPHRIKSDSISSKHKKPTSKDSIEYHKRISCLSPYYNPDNDAEEKSPESNSNVYSNNNNITETKSSSQDVESSSDELDNDEAVILNLCLKCQPSQPNNAMKVNTLSGKESLSCDICGLTFSHSLEDGEPSTPDSEPKSENLAEPSEAVGIETKPSETGGNIAKPSEAVGTPKKHSNGLVASDSIASLSEPNSQEKDKQDNRTIEKLLEKGEKIRHMFRVARVQGLDVHEGLLLFGQDHYYIIDGFTMLKSKEIRDISSLPGEHEPIIPSSSRHSQDNLKNEAAFSDRMCSKFPYSDLSEVHKRRYLLQNISLEVFNKDGRNCLLVFPQGTPAKVFNKFSSYLSDRGKDSISGQRTGLSVEQQGPVLFGLNVFGERTVTSRWERGEISNFQYLMYLNTLAGRSYNDLMQYPVFPWIIADYDSDTLDLSKPETFRDLSKPMGSQTPDRLEQYKKRYKDWEELGGIDTPPYHYGTHYSSAMIVASYLVRMEPFTQHFLRLQGGHFDLADRMFHSIKDSWVSASQKNMADVKELIPEFFYLPEFLLNTNRFDLGQKQNGVHLDDVILPPWAKGSPHEFIRAHREALECDYVSSHLHEWIDLIFGFKQKGDAALESYNVFHHLFYEGEVDIYSIKDPLKRNATIGFINNFGQIPKQLFKRPHPQKKVKSESSGFMSGEQKFFYKHVESLSTGNPIKELGGPVGQIVVQDRGIAATEQGKILIPPSNTRYVSFGHKDLSIRVGLHESDRSVQIFENLGCDEVTCAAMANEELLVTGNKSTVVHVWRIPNLKDKSKTLELIKCLYGHTKSVCSIAICASYGIIVSGAEDGSCVLWDLNHLAFVRQLQHHNDAPISHICINEHTGVIVTCSGTNLYQWSINGQLIACASALSSNVRNQRITVVATSKLNDWDPEGVVISGHSDGHLRFWRLEYVQVPESAEIDLQVYGNSNAKKLSPMHINLCKTPDTVSLASIGEVAELPWNDVSKVELSNQDSARHDTSTNQEVQPSKNKPMNMKWKQQLVLKGKIELPKFKNISTSSYTPSVTCIAVSKNHENLYVGDDEGRIYSWSCS